MIAYYLTYAVNPGGKVTERPKCWRYDGKVTFPLSRSTAVWLYDSHDRPFQKRRVTLFDDSHSPPKLIREDYPVKDLRKFKYIELPSLFIDERGNIVNTSGETVMQGPTNP